MRSVLGVHWKEWCSSWNSSTCHLIQRADSFEKPLMLGKIEVRRRRGWQRMRWLNGITNSMDEFEQTLGDSEPLSVSYHFAFSYCSWGSQGKNSEMVCHSLLQWTTFCQTSPPWPTHLGWPHMAWLSFIELDKAVVRVIRLASLLWLWFQSVCPPMPSLSTYHHTWVSLTLDVG